MDAITAPKIIDESLQNIAAHIKRIFMILGISGNNVPQDLEFDFLVRTYKLSFSQFTLKEIELAFKLAINLTIEYNLNLYDKMFSVVYVSDLMKRYTDYKRQSTEYQKSRVEFIPEKSEAEIYAIMKTAALDSFTEYKKGNPEYVKFYIYDWLNRNEILVPTLERKKTAMIRAKEQIEAELNSKKGLISRSRLIDLERMLLGEGVQIARAKELNLKEFFDDMIETGTELIDLIN